MDTRRVDVAILGAGTAGLTARRAAEKAGAQALLIGQSPFGTTCARVGCMPSKLLIAAADAAHHVRDAEVFGIHTTLNIDGRAVMKRVQSERDRFVGFVLESTDNLQQDNKLLVGRGRFLDAHTLQVDDHTRVEASSFVIATGSTPRVPPPYRELKHPLLTNDHIFEQETLPESVLVVGTGVIGLELGQALHRLGVRTTLIGRGGVLGHLSDPKVSAVAHDVFSAELDIHTDPQVHSVRDAEGGGVEVSFTGADGKRRTETFAEVLLAAGRTSNLGNIGLENTGIELDARGRVSYDPYTMQIGESHVFIAGDVNGDRALLHEAADEGRIAGANAAHFPEVLVKTRSTPISVIFSDPQIAIVGESYPETRLPGRDRCYGEVDYSRQGRSRVMNQNKGWVRIYGKAHTGCLKGAEMCGPRVEHTAHLLAWAIQQKLTVSQVLEMPFYHPVVEEGIRTALRDLQTNMHLALKAGEPCEEVGPGG